MADTSVLVGINLDSKIEVDLGSDGYGINMFRRIYANRVDPLLLRPSSLPEADEFLEERKVEDKENVYVFTLRELMAYYGPLFTPDHERFEVPIPFDALTLVQT